MGEPWQVKVLALLSHGWTLYLQSPGEFVRIAWRSPDGDEVWFDGLPWEWLAQLEQSADSLVREPPAPKEATP